LRLTLLDLPEVIPSAHARLSEAGLSARFTLVPGSFRTDPLPEGADTISLIRVLYDHDDATVTALLAKVHAALPVGGQLIVAEPMAGGARPERAGDVYFAFYTMAMGTGRARSAARIAEMCRAAGFADIRIPHSPRPFVTSTLSCVKNA
jgi:demethylspheroidene O-methyltransferase